MSERLDRLRGVVLVSFRRRNVSQALLAESLSHWAWLAHEEKGERAKEEERFRTESVGASSMFFL